MKVGVLTDIHLGSYEEKDEQLDQFADSIQGECEVLVLSGDLASTDPLETERCLKILRRRNPFLPILFVPGNHDFWSTNWDFRTITDILEFHKKICKENKIHHLENDGEFVLNDVSFMGYMGWYASLNNDTKDYGLIPKSNPYGADTFSYMKKLEGDALDKMAATEITAPKKVCVTHFNLFPDGGYENLSGNPRFFELFLKDKFDVLIMGHSHVAMDEVKDGCRVINAGADYKESPEHHFKIIEI